MESGSDVQDEPLQTTRPGWMEWSGRRVCLFDFSVGWNAFHRAYFDEVGAGASHVLYQAGLRVGASWCGRVRPVDCQHALERGLEILTSKGFGSFQLSGDGPADDVYCVTAHNAIEAWSHLQHQGRSRHPVCAYTRGMLAGTICLSRDGQAGADAVCWETDCIAAGADQCRFVIGPPDRLRELGVSPPAQDRSVRWEIEQFQRQLESSKESLNTVREVLSAREAGYRNLLDNMNDLLLVLGPDKRIIFCNKRYLESTGLTLDEALGTSPLDRIVAEDKPTVEAIYDELLSGARTNATYIVRVKRPSGTFFIESSARAITGPEAVAAIEILARDVSERERARQDLEAAHKALLHKQRVADKDLKVAKLVHESLLPRPVSQREIDVDVKYVPVDRVGGDYCQISFPGERHCVLSVCDVSGHGMASALLAARVSSHVRVLTEQSIDPLEITVNLNSFLRAHFSETGLFVTFFVVVIDLQTLKMTYCGAGHPGPLIFRKATRSVDALVSQNLPVGIIDEFLREPSTSTTTLATGDRIILYTDGLTETMNEERKPFQIDGLKACVLDAAETPFFKLGDRILRRVNEFRHGDPLDDLTLLVAEARRKKDGG